MHPAQHPDVGAPIAISDPSSLAWEVLRRNPAYRADFATWAALPATERADHDFAARWGVHFP